MQISEDTITRIARKLQKLNEEQDFDMYALPESVEPDDAEIIIRAASPTTVTRFAVSLYESQLVDTDTNQVLYYIRTDPQVLTLTVAGDANEAPTVGSSTVVNLFVNASGRRRNGITARLLDLVRLQGTSPNQYPIRRRVPILQSDNFYQWLSLASPTISYQGQTDWRIAGGRGESYKLP